MTHEDGSGSGVADRSELAVRTKLLEEPDLAVEAFLAAVSASMSEDLLVDGTWTIHDVVGHITFWHESFARNVDDLINARRPTPLRGRLADLNKRGVAEASTAPLGTIVNRLRAAQEAIRASILSPTLGLIPYRVGSRPYTPSDHLGIVRDHIVAHGRRLQRVSDLSGGQLTRPVRDDETGS